MWKKGDKFAPTPWNNLQSFINWGHPSEDNCSMGSPFGQATWFLTTACLQTGSRPANGIGAIRSSESAGRTNASVSSLMGRIFFEQSYFLTIAFRSTTYCSSSSPGFQVHHTELSGLQPGSFLRCPPFPLLWVPYLSQPGGVGKAYQGTPKDKSLRSLQCQRGLRESMNHAHGGQRTAGLRLIA
jgi:hypothetical protein